MQTYTLQPEDYEQAARLHYRDSALKGGVYWFLLAAIVTVLMLSGALGDLRRSLTAVVFPLMLGSALAAHLVNYFILIRFRTHRSYKEHKRAHLPIESEFDDSGIHFKTALGQSLVPWDHITKWRETERHFLLYPTKSLYYILPKSAFSGQTKVEAFRSYISAVQTKAVGAKAE